MWQIQTLFYAFLLNTMLRIHLIWFGSWNNTVVDWIQVINIYLGFTDFFFYRRRILNYFSYIFFHLFLCNNFMNHSEIRTFLIISLLLTVQIWILSAKDFFCSFGWYFVFGSGSVDPHIFAESDPGSQNAAIQQIRILSTGLDTHFF